MKVSKIIFRPAGVRRTTLITLLCGCFLVGLGVARLRVVTPWVVMILGVGLAVWLLKKGWRVVGWWVLVGLCLGLWRGSGYLRRVGEYQKLIGRPVVLQGRALGDAVYGERGQLAFDLGSLRVVGYTAEAGQPLVGVVKVQSLGEQMIYKGDVMWVSGKLFPARGSRQASLSFAQAIVQQRANSPLDNWRRRFVAGAQTALPEPQASFGLGLLIGQRSLLPKDTSDLLAAVGLTHLVAVSGYNLTILIDGTRRLLAKRSKYQSTMAALALMSVFILCTGLSASIVRAALVSSLSLAAWYYGRQVKPLLLIILVAAVTAAWNPLYLWSDIGWHLSFLAFFGVLVLAPLLASSVTRQGKQPHALLALLAECLAAQVMTLPLIMYIFGRLSLIGLVANLLIVPLIPVSMLLTVVSGLAGMLLPALAGWWSWPARLLLTYELDVAQALSSFPHGLVQRSIAWPAMLILYLVIVAVIILLWRRHRLSKPDIITE